MARVLRMPEIAANTTEAVLHGWPVPENTTFSAGDAIATVETAKAVVDVEADADGVMLKTLAVEGAAVQVGQPIAVLGEPGESVGDLAALLNRLGVAVPNRPAAEPPGRPDRADPTSPAPTPPAEDAVVLNGQAAATRIFASPLARRLARDAGIAPALIRGTGPGGRIVRRDVETAVSQRGTTAAVAAAVPSPRAPGPTADPSVPLTVPDASVNHGSHYTERPHSLMRKAIAARLTASKQTTPHFYVRGTCRVDRLLDLRHELNAGGSARLSVNDLVIKAAARAHVLVPALNVVWTPEAIRSFAGVDIAVAIAVDGGLVTPVLRSVEQVSVSAVAGQVRDFAVRAKEGRLRPDELEGGTLTITNLGMYGVEEFAAIINPPQAAILAVGAIRKEPVVRDGQVDVGTVMRVTLSVDHRAVDGVPAGEWMRAFVSIIENPLQMLL
jgi:pyruvate dehydrogenase E2 component (dihydrolipoamide acetyltransferase)